MYIAFLDFLARQESKEWVFEPPQNSKYKKTKINEKSKICHFLPKYRTHIFFFETGRTKDSYD